MPKIKLCDGALSLLSWIENVTRRKCEPVFLIMRPDSVHASDLVDAGFLRVSPGEGFVVTPDGEECIATSDLKRAVIDARNE